MAVKNTQPNNGSYPFIDFNDKNGYIKKRPLIVSLEVEIESLKNIEIKIDKVLEWLDEFSRFKDQNLENYSWFVHSDGAFPETKKYPDAQLIYSRNRSFFIFANAHQVFSVPFHYHVKDVLMDLGAYGSVKAYFVRNQNADQFAQRIRDEIFESEIHYQDVFNECLLEKLDIDDFIEIDTWTECAGDMTYLNVFYSNNFTGVPRIRLPNPQ